MLGLSGPGHWGPSLDIQVLDHINRDLKDRNDLKTLYPKEPDPWITGLACMCKCMNARLSIAQPSKAPPSTQEKNPYLQHFSREMKWRVKLPNVVFTELCLSPFSEIIEILHTFLCQCRITKSPKLCKVILKTLANLTTLIFCTTSTFLSQQS